MNHVFDSSTKAGTIGGTLLSFLANIDLASEVIGTRSALEVPAGDTSHVQHGRDFIAIGELQFKVFEEDFFLFFDGRFCVRSRPVKGAGNFFE